MGMSAWYDVIDWVGGYPFEVAKPEEIFDFYHERGFRLELMRTEGSDLAATSSYLANRDKDGHSARLRLQAWPFLIVRCRPSAQ